jgi:hypothetical protein
MSSIWATYNKAINRTRHAAVVSSSVAPPPPIYKCPNNQLVNISLALLLITSGNAFFVLANQQTL